MSNSNTITDGSFELMGDGVAVVPQDSDEEPQSVALTADDLRAILTALGA